MPMHSHHHIQRPDRGQPFGQAMRSFSRAFAPVQVRRDPEFLVITGAGFVVRWHLTSGPWPAAPSAAIGPLQGFHHAILAPGTAWPMHVHEDLQSVTYVVTGALEHSDSLGNHGDLTAGGVQQRWLGWGSEHQERNPSATERTEFIQLWLQTPHPDTTALEQHAQYAAMDRFERWLEIVRSECSPSDGLMVNQDARVHVVRVDSSSRRLEYEFEPGRGGYIYVIDGDAEANQERLHTGDAAHVTAEGRLHIQAFGATELLIVDVPV
jgi:quercetin 2,3-dioxygenase